MPALCVREKLYFLWKPKDHEQKPRNLLVEGKDSWNEAEESRVEADLSRADPSLKVGSDEGLLAQRRWHLHQWCRLNLRWMNTELFYAARVNYKAKELLHCGQPSSFTDHMSIFVIYCQEWIQNFEEDGDWE